MKLGATEKGRNQEAETRDNEFPSLTSSLKLSVSCQDWEMKIAGEGQATQTSAPADRAVKGFKVCEELMKIKTAFDGVLN